MLGLALAIANAAACAATDGMTAILFSVGALGFAFGAGIAFAMREGYPDAE